MACNKFLLGEGGRAALDQSLPFPSLPTARGTRDRQTQARTARPRSVDLKPCPFETQHCSSSTAASRNFYRCFIPFWCSYRPTAYGANALSILQKDGHRGRAASLYAPLVENRPYPRISFCSERKCNGRRWDDDETSTSDWQRKTQVHDPSACRSEKER